MACKGTKRKLDHESSDSGAESLQKTDTEIMLKAKQIMEQVTENFIPTISTHEDIIVKINKMNNVSRKKATIGVIGKSGEGKSSLLSAVFGKQDLLPSGCFGACTAVVTQVEANLTDSNYTAEIEFITKEEWENELSDLFKVLSAEDEDRNEDLIEIAKEKITALYGADAHKKTLEELKKDAKYAEIEVLLSNSKKTILNKKVSEFANDVVSYILHSEASTGGWYWPIVKNAAFKVPDCHELLEHIVLVDIPGSGDRNKERDDKWKSTLSECSSVWVVSDINRALTDIEPWGILKHCIEQLGPGGECRHINFICTKTDIINPVAYKRSARLSNQISADKDLKKECIIHRNEHAKKRIKEKFEVSDIKKKFGADDDFLKVFTVSSNAFFDHNLSLEPSETEIPKLRDDLRSLNKSVTRELTRAYVNEAKGVLSLIQSVQLDKDEKTVSNESKAKLHVEFEKSLKKALNELEKILSEIYDKMEQHLSEGVEESVQNCVASTKAMIAPPNVDNRGFHNTLQALCKYDGRYWSKNWDTILDLNRDLAKHLHESVNEYFIQIFPVNGTTGMSLQEQIDKFSVIQSDSASFSFPKFLQNLIEIEETNLKASLKRDIVEMKKDIYLSVTRTIKNEMSSYYKQAAAVKGLGSMKKRQELLINTVDKIKQDMFNTAKMEMLKKLKNLKLYIKDAFKSELRKTMELSSSQTEITKSMDVSREIEELERLSGLLSD